MDQNIRVVVTGKSSARLANMIKSLKDIDVSSVGLSSFAESMRSDSESAPVDLFIFSLSEHWEKDIKIFLSAFDGVIPAVIVIGPGQNPDLMRRAMQAGAKDYLNEGFSESEFRASVIHQLDSIRGNRVALDNQMIVCISPKGSTESAFLTSNLAYINAILGERRVAALDFDFQFGSLPLYFDLKLERSMLQALETIHSLDLSSLEAYMTIHSSGLFIGGAFEHDMVLPGEVTVDSLDQLLRLLNSAFGRVFINLPLHISPLTSLVLARADKIIIVVEQEIICLRNSKSLMTVLRKDIEIPSKKINVVISRYQKNHHVSSVDIENALENVVTYVVPDDTPTVNESINTGVPMYTSATNSSVTKSLLKIAEEINGEKFKRRPGLLGKAFSYITKH